MLTFQLDALSTLALALLLLGLGAQLKKRSYWLRQLCVPAPVIGGFGFALLIWLLRDRQLLDLTLDTSLQTPLMVAFLPPLGWAAAWACCAKVANCCLSTWGRAGGWRWCKTWWV